MKTWTEICVWWWIISTSYSDIETWSGTRGRTNSVSWRTFSATLNCKFHDWRSDMDIQELRRACKQLAGEVFDDFHNAILNPSDRLRVPACDAELLKIEICSQIYWIRVNFSSELRAVYRRRELYSVNRYWFRTDQTCIVNRMRSSWNLTTLRNATILESLK